MNAPPPTRRTSSMPWRRAKIACASRDASWAPCIPSTSISKTTCGVRGLYSLSPEERSIPMLAWRRLHARTWGALAPRVDCAGVSWVDSALVCRHASTCSREQRDTACIARTRPLTDCPGTPINATCQHAARQRARSPRTQLPLQGAALHCANAASITRINCSVVPKQNHQWRPLQKPQRS